MTSTGQPRSLDDVLDARRIELDMRWKDVADAAQLTTQALLDIRTGKTKPRSRTKRRIDLALHWEPGSFQAVLDGGDPTPLPEGANTSPPPEAHLIANAAKDSRLPPRKAAELAGLRPDVWRDIIDGATAPAPAETIARMAHVTGLTPNDLNNAGRPDAATALNAILHPATPPAPSSQAEQPRPQDVLADEAEVEIWKMVHLSEVERADHLATLRARRLTAELRKEIADLRDALAEQRERPSRRAG